MKGEKGIIGKKIVGIQHYDEYIEAVLDDGMVLEVSGIFKGIRLPEFVSFAKGGTCLRHVGGGNYHRDAGAWTVSAKIVDGRIIIKKGQNPHLKHCEGLELLPTTQKKWMNDNGEHVPSEYRKMARADKMGFDLPF